MNLRNDFFKLLGKTMLDITDLKDLPKELRISTMTATSKFNSPIESKTTL